MTEFDLRRYILDVCRSLIRIGFVAGVLWMTATNFDDTEATVIGGVAAAEFGIRGFDWSRKKQPADGDNE